MTQKDCLLWALSIDLIILVAIFTIALAKTGYDLFFKK